MYAGWAIIPFSFEIGHTPNLLSHGKYAIYEPREMVEDTKQLFRQILNAFLSRYQFVLPGLLAEATTLTEDPS